MLNNRLFVIELFIIPISVFYFTYYNLKHINYGRANKKRLQ
jgi:hypothetical protein